MMISNTELTYMQYELYYDSTHIGIEQFWEGMQLINHMQPLISCDQAT